MLLSTTPVWANPKARCWALTAASRKLAIFVHGCFWHGHDCARGARMPKTNAAYWQAKIARNRARDAKTLAAYPALGWRAVVVYECELKDKAALGARLAAVLRPAQPAQPALTLTPEREKRAP